MYHFESVNLVRLWVKFQHVVPLEQLILAPFHCCLNRHMKEDFVSKMWNSEGKTEGEKQRKREREIEGEILVGYFCER